MPTIVEPAGEFRNLSRVQVQAALLSIDPGNPVAVEVARLIKGYAVNFAAYRNDLSR